MAQFTVQVNGIQQTVVAEPEMPLLWVLRDLLCLTGAKYGCGIGLCGACTVHLNGAAARSCQIQVANAVGKQITTIAGLGQNGPHPVQRLDRRAGAAMRLLSARSDNVCGRIAV